MRKLLGSICILAGGVLAQYLKKGELRRQAGTRADVLLALRRMEEEIRLTRLPLPCLLESVCEDCGAEAEAFFRETAKAVRKGEPLPDIWHRETGRLSLPETEKKQFSALGKELKGDESSICKAISLAIIQMQRLTEKWQQSRMETEKKISVICFSATALLLILLI